MRSFVFSLFCSSRLHFRIPRGTFHSELLSSIIVIIMLCITRFIIHNLLRISTIIHARTGLHGMKRVVLLGVGASGGRNTKARLGFCWMFASWCSLPTDEQCISRYTFPLFTLSLFNASSHHRLYNMFLLRFLYNRLCPLLL